MISKARNAKHITLLQPIKDFHFKNDKNYLVSKKKLAYKLIRESVYCKVNFCLDLSQVKINDFDIIFNGSNYNKALFFDSVHLTDLGNEFYSKIITNYLKLNVF